VLDLTLGVAKGIVKRHSGVTGKTKYVLDARSGKNFHERSCSLHR
jgi:hypothetical protein